MTILLYVMDGCGYCDKAEKLLQNEINTGEIVKKNSKEAPQGLFNGFPGFLNTSNRLTHTGLPSNKDQLYSKLGLYNDSLSPQLQKPGIFCTTTPFTPGFLDFIMTVKPSSPSSLSTTSQPSYILVSISIDLKPSMNNPINPSPTCGSPSTTIQTTDPAAANYVPYLDSLNKSLNGNLSKLFLKLFPCTTLNDWVNGSSILQAYKNNKLIPPQPCGKNGLYYCNGDISKCNVSFFDTKTIIMLIIIVILASINIFLAMKR